MSDSDRAVLGPKRGSGETAERASRLVLLARLKGAWMVGLLPVVGYGYGLWERGALVGFPEAAPTLALLWTSWVACHAGTMWLNAVLDRDEGTLLLGRAVPVPRGTRVAGHMALIASVAIAAAVGPIPVTCSLGCALLAVLYSHPAIALKGRPAGGPIVNAVGYGVLTPLAGWAAADPVPCWRTLLSLVLLVVGVLGAYLAAQAFQQSEDRRRGYRTLVAIKGPGWTLRAARLCLALTSAGLVASAVAGVYPRAVVVAAPALVWLDLHMVRWCRIPDGGDGRWADRLIVRIAIAALLAVGAAYAHHFHRLARGEPAGGRGTAVVPSALEGVAGRGPDTGRFRDGP